MTREQLLEHHIYVPEKLDYEDIKLHEEMGYRILAYASHLAVYCFIKHRHIDMYELEPCTSTRYFNYTNFGLRYEQCHNCYFITDIWLI